MLKKLFLDLGYNEREYTKIVSDHSLKKYLEETLYERVKDNFNHLKSLGYNNKQVIKMTKSLPTLLSITKENIDNKIKDLKSLGYSEKNILRMTIKLPSLFSYDIESLKDKLDHLVSIGFTKKEAIKITSKTPNIFSLDKEKNINKKINDIKELGYTDEEVIKIIKGFPAIFSSSLENIKEKIEYYDSIGLHDMAFTIPMLLMQSTDLTFARYEFYKSQDIAIDMSNFYRLFIVQRQFEKMYGITKENLLRQYSYKKYKEEKSNGVSL